VTGVAVTIATGLPQSVQQAEGQMAELANSPAPDEAALLLLELRKAMDADQVKRLESKR
jgi:hypothetical protein